MQNIYVKVLYTSGVEREYMIENGDDVTFERLKQTIENHAHSFKQGFGNKIYTATFSNNEKIVQINFEHVVEVTWEIR